MIYVLLVVGLTELLTVLLKQNFMENLKIIFLVMINATSNVKQKGLLPVGREREPSNGGRREREERGRRCKKN